MAKKKDSNELILKVGSVNPDDANKGVVRVDSKIMAKIDLRPGDVVEIEGEKKTVAIIDRAYPGDIGLEIIKMDGITRRNAGTNMGENIKIRKAEVKEAKKITIAPAKKGIIVRANEEVLKRGLVGRVVVKGDFLSMGSRRRRNSMPMNDGTIFGELFKSLMDDGDFFGSGVGMGFGGLGGDILFMVVDVNPKNTPVIIGPETEISLNPEAVDIEQESVPDITYDDVGGLKDEILKVREMIELPLRHPEIFERLGIEPPKGVLLHGPPGTGKTLLARAVASETNAHFITINGPEIMSKFYGESEKNLRAKFEEAEKNAPSIVFIDEIDAIAPKRGESHDQAEKRVVTQLLTLMDGLKSRGQVVVMAATNRPDDLDEALRRPGRFDRELKINPPSEQGRKEILQIHTRNMPVENREALLEEISQNTLGYTGADLEVLCKEAALRSVKPYYKSLLKFTEASDSMEGEELKNAEEEKRKLIGNIKVTRQNFLDALKTVEPSAMREVLIKKPNVSWNDVGGLENAKEKLRELVELPLARPDLYSEAGIKPSKGVLLTGGPGTGKTLLAKAVAHESNANFISVKGPELISKWVGESEKHVREIFKKARQVAPSIIFFDEFDSISKLRGASMSDATEKVVNQLLTELDGIEELEKVVVIAATNRRDLIDPALLRPGRIDSIVELEIPDKKTRLEIFKVHTRNMPLSKDIKIEDYVNKTEGWNGAEIESICRNAGINAIKRVYKKDSKTKIEITKDDFENSFKELAKQIGKPLEEQKNEKEESKKTKSSPKKKSIKK